MTSQLALKSGLNRGPTRVQKGKIYINTRKKKNFKNGRAENAPSYQRLRCKKAVMTAANYQGTGGRSEGI
jgi:hypothetical protein